MSLFHFLQGFTYVAPSVLEDMQSRITMPRSPRRMHRHNLHQHHQHNHHHGSAHHHHHGAGSSRMMGAAGATGATPMENGSGSSGAWKMAPHQNMHNHHPHVHRGGGQMVPPNQQQQQQPSSAQQPHNQTQPAGGAAGVSGGPPGSRPFNAASISRRTPPHLQPFAPRPSPQDEMMDVYPEMSIS